MTKRRKSPAKKAGIKFAIERAKDNQKTIRFSDREKDPEHVRKVLEGLKPSIINPLLYKNKKGGHSVPALFAVVIIGMKSKGKTQYYSKVLAKPLMTPTDIKKHVLDTFDKLQNDSLAASELMEVLDDDYDVNEGDLMTDETKEYLKGVDISRVDSVTIKMVHLVNKDLEGNVL